MSKLTRYLISLVAFKLVFFFLLGGVLYLSQYGPLAVLSFIAGMVSVAFFLNDAKNHSMEGWIAGGVSRQRREAALERFVREVKDRNVTGEKQS